MGGFRDSQILRALYHHGLNIFLAHRRHKPILVRVKEPEFQPRDFFFFFLNLAPRGMVIERYKRLIVSFREHKSSSRASRPLRSVQKRRMPLHIRGE